MANDVLWALQVPVFDLLDGDGTLTTLAPGGVHDEPPHNLTTDYVLIGDFTEIPDDDHSASGREVTMTLHIYSFALGNQNTFAIKRRIEELLHRQPPASTDWRISDIALDFAETIRERDTTDGTRIRHTPVRYRVKLREV